MADGSSAAGIQEVSVPRRGSRPARIARLKVRFARLTLKPPQDKAQLPELSVWAVHAREVDHPNEVKPLEWMLLTTAKVATFEQALEKLELVYAALGHRGLSPHP